MLELINILDRNIIELVYKHTHNYLLDIIMPLITKLGNSGAVWLIIIIVLLLLKKYRKIGLMAMFSLILTYVIVSCMKHLFHRHRPFYELDYIKLLIKTPKDFSFPSGHASSSFATSFAVYLNSKNKVLSVSMIVLAILISLSRIYLCVHYPTDVICGAIIGILSALFVYYLAHTWQNSKKYNK